MPDARTHEATQGLPAVGPPPAPVSLDRIRRGGSFTVERIADEHARITALRFGIAEGATASCITRVPAGPVIIRSGRQEIAIGRALARRITVSPHDNGSARV